MIQIRWFMTGMSDGDVDMGTLPFATEGEAAAFECGTMSIQDPPGTEHKFNTEIEAKWFDAGRSDANSCISNGYGIRTERLTAPAETSAETSIDEFVPKFIAPEKRDNTRQAGDEQSKKSHRTVWVLIVLMALAVIFVIAIVTKGNQSLTRSAGHTYEESSQIKSDPEGLRQVRKNEILRFQLANLARQIPISSPSVLQGKYVSAGPKVYSFRRNWVYSLA